MTRPKKGKTFDTVGATEVTPVQARAREATRGPKPDVWAEFCKRVAEGKQERIAAMGLGVPYTTIRSWMDHRGPAKVPGVPCQCSGCAFRDQLLDARAVEIQRRLDRMEQTPFEVGAAETKTEDGATSGLHPKAAELLMKHDRWRLEGLDPEQFLPPQRVETTGKDGGPIKTEVTGVVRLPVSPLRKPGL